MAKGEKCPNCCPDGGAVFRMDYGWGGRDYNSPRDVYAMTCQNCGYQRTPRPRKANPLKNYDFVTSEATSDKGMGARFATYFHCFNPNGAYAQLKQMHVRLDGWLEAHPDRPNGVLFVYGSLHDHPRKTLFAVLDLIKARKAHAYALSYALGLICEEIEKGDGFINDPARWPAPKSVD